MFENLCIIFYFCFLQKHPVLKVVFHGSKLKNFPEGDMPEEVSSIVIDFQMLESAQFSLTMLDVSMLSVFVERWHPETSSFHILFGEMTITLNDVDALFHISVG